MSQDRRRYPPPHGLPLIVHVVVNIENWVFDEPMPRKLLPAPHGVEVTPDIPNFSWAEYGMRCGMPRLIDALESFGVRASCTMNAGVIDSYPRVAEVVINAGWEFVGHGLHQRSLQSKDVHEGELIANALAILRGFSGQPVEGWLGPGLKETMDTPDFLKRDGIRYCCDWVIDDLPSWMQTKYGPLIAMPYSLEINDSVLHAAHQYPSDELLRRLTNSLETFETELASNPRVLTIALHPHLIGVPHRIKFLRKMLDQLRKRHDTIFMTGREIADWFETVEPVPATTLVDHGAS
jgi:peptidoglycan/xylan/chitin deacetylase (PgdA/CDA1 family)